MGNPITDWWTGDSPERRQLREAKGRGGAGYNPDTGLTELGNGTKAVIAPLNGVPGFLDPTTGNWIKHGAPNSKTGQQSQGRYRQVLEGNKAENARAAKGGFLQPKAKPSETIKEAKTKVSAAQSLRAGRTPDTKPPVDLASLTAGAQDLRAGRTPDRQLPVVETPTVDTPPVETTPASTDVRTGANGITQKGMTLGGIKNYLQGSGFELSDAGQLFDLPSSFGVPAADTPTPEAKTPAAVPGTTGGNTDNPQDGASPKPDQTESATEIKFDHPNGKQSDWMKPGSTRNLAVQAFLDPKNKGYGAIKARNAAVGVANIPGQGIAVRSGDNYYQYTGEGKASDVAFDITGGKKGFIKHQDDFTLLESPDSKPEPGTPAPDDEQTPAIIPTEKDMRVSGQQFADLALQMVKKK